VQLNEAEVNDLLAQKLQDDPSSQGSLRYVHTTILFVILMTIELRPCNVFALLCVVLCLTQ
jgi:hypothetical protein